MEYHTEVPAGNAHVAKGDVVLAQGILDWYVVSNFRQAVLMGEEVEQGEQHRERLLYTEEAVEGPFPMILHDGLKHGRFPSDAAVCDDVLADIVAIGGACPEQEAEVQGCRVSIMDNEGAHGL